MTRKGEEGYRPSYVYIDGHLEPFYWDKMVVRNNGFTAFYIAYGDGAHCICNGYLDSCGCFEDSYVPYHIGELDRLIRSADYIRCEQDKRLTYERGVA